MRQPFFVFFFQLYFSIKRLLILSSVPEAVNEFAYPPRCWCDSSPPGRERRRPSSLSFSPNTVSACNGCKSIHSKVKQFVLLEPLLCLCRKMESMSSYTWAWSHLPNVGVSSACFIRLVIYWIEKSYNININMCKQLFEERMKGHMDLPLNTKCRWVQKLLKVILFLRTLPSCVHFVLTIAYSSHTLLPGGHLDSPIHEGLHLSQD